MSDMILSIAAEAAKGGEVPSGEVPRRRSGSRDWVEDLPAHSFPGWKKGEADDNPEGADAGDSGMTEEQAVEESAVARRALEWEEQRRRGIYRGRTINMLRRYMRYSIETGRLPSLLGREFFRATVTSYTVVTFEDRVIFVHDMETCLSKLDEFSRAVLGRVVLQEYGHEDAARLLGCTRMTVHRTMLNALDELSRILVRLGLLEPLFPDSQNCCQGGLKTAFLVSDCNVDE